MPVADGIVFPYTASWSIAACFTVTAAVFAESVGVNPVLTTAIVKVNFLETADPPVSGSSISSVLSSSSPSSQVSTSEVDT